MSFKLTFATMKRLKFYLVLALIAFVITSFGQERKAKYVFLFIGDGMGLAQVSLTQAYLSSLDGQVGMNSLEMTQFPVTGFISTFANDREITGSAAAGTALATGRKTDHDIISMSPDKKEIYKSIAQLAKENGMRVGIVTSTSIDHATPAVFYAHQPNRNMYFEIGQQLAGSNFDYFAGGGFKEPVKEVNGKKVDLIELAKNNGFYVMNNLEEFKDMTRTRRKVIMFAPRTGYESSLPFVLDAGSGDVTLEDFTGKGIDLLDGPEGFFMMVEGGKIDWACHSNDAGSAIQEVLAFDRAIGLAVDFYREHPDETIIVVTADHETGGLSLGNRTEGYDSDLAVFQYQEASVEKLTRMIKTLREKKTGKEEEDFNKLLEILEKDLGLNSRKNHTDLTDEEKARLREVMVESLYSKKDEKAASSEYEPLVGAALDILSKRAGIAWGTGSHTFIAVPVYAIGVGAEEFDGFMDNTDIPKKLEKLMGIE